VLQGHGHLTPLTLNQDPGISNRNELRNDESDHDRHGEGGGFSEEIRPPCGSLWGLPVAFRPQRWDKVGTRGGSETGFQDIFSR
jgi:hypothetical protein